MKILVATIAVIAIFVLYSIGSGIYTDWLWFESLGFQGVYATSFFAKTGLFVSGALVFFVTFVANVALAWRLAPKPSRWPPLEEIIIESGELKMDARAIDRIIKVAVVPIGLFLALIMGSAASEQWDVVLRYRAATPFGVADPLFNTDVGFYVFTLPFYRFIQSWLLASLVMLLVAGVGIYWYKLSLWRLSNSDAGATISRPMKAHAFVLGAGLLLLLAWHHRLQIYELVYSHSGVVFGAGYTDVHALMPVLWILTVVAALGAIALIANIFVRGFWLVASAAGTWIAILLLGTWLYPAFVQQFEVLPSEIAKESTYIENDIKMTRQAFGLDRIEEQDFPTEEGLSFQDIQKNPDTITNIRLWDNRPLKDVYNQIQSIRGYYEFNDVDIDRYTVDGQYRQVMLSAREFVQDKLPANAQTWVNQRLQYTHGYGAVMSPVNEITTEGLPNLFLQDVPPRGKLPLDRPEIYFGEKTTGNVIVNTGAKEFDFPKGDENVQTQYQGKGGVALDSYFKKLVFASQFGDPNILFTNYITSESRILYFRDIKERVQRVVPFLLLDNDPYLVVADGRLSWIQDAYTYTDKYPYSQPFQDRLNYIRNSVKIVIDAYHGTMSLYVADPNDPLIVTYSAIFPGLFTPMGQMPASLASHVRYPEDLFKVQVEMYRAYHMRDANVFYNKEDLWKVPNEIFDTKEQPVEPYYVIMRIPGQPKEEFVLMIPFTPPNKDNIIAWLAARSDGADYGKLLVFKFPKDRLIYGPMQIDARIDQDPTISGQFTLWNQGGSRIIRGNTLVIPIEKSNLYVEPIYLQAEKSRMPELKRVITATGNKLVMETTLSESLAKLFGQPTTAPLPGAPPTTAPPTAPGAQLPATAASLVQTARQHYNAAQDALKTGNWAKYGEELKALEQDLARLEALTR